MDGNQVDINLEMKRVSSLSPIESEDENEVEIIEKDSKLGSANLTSKPSLCKLPSLDQMDERKLRAEEAYNKILKEIYGHHFLVDDLKYKLRNLHSQPGHEQEIRKLSLTLGREKLKIDSLEAKALIIRKRFTFYSSLKPYKNSTNILDTQRPSGGVSRNFLNPMKKPFHRILWKSI